MLAWHENDKQAVAYISADKSAGYRSVILYQRTHILHFLQIAVTVPTVSSIEDSTANLFVLVKKRGCPVHGVLRAPLLRQGMQLLLFGLKASSFHQEITSNHCRRPLCGQ